MPTVVWLLLVLLVLVISVLLSWLGNYISNLGEEKRELVSKVFACLFRKYSVMIVIGRAVHAFTGYITNVGLVDLTIPE